jgi:hypothetical protein
MKVQPVFHVSLLEPYKESNILGRIQPPPPCIEIDSHEEYEVEAVLDSQQRRGRHGCHGDRQMDMSVHHVR